MDQRQGIGNKYSFTIDDNTRAVIGDENVEWTEGDKVGMFVGSFKGSADVDVSTSPKTVVLYSESAIPAGTKAYAYYPYDLSFAGLQVGSGKYVPSAELDAYVFIMQRHFPRPPYLFFIIRNMKNGAPMNAVTMPRGSSDAPCELRAKASAHIM